MILNDFYRLVVLFDCIYRGAKLRLFLILLKISAFFFMN